VNRWFVALVIAAGCKAKADERPAEPAHRTTLTSVELQRGRDACKAYVDAICACARDKKGGDDAAELVRQCDLARALPDALRISEEVSLSADSTPKDVAQAEDSARKTVKECIEETAKLPVGCGK
jgi:hypothetical protein